MWSSVNRNQSDWTASWKVSAPPTLSLLQIRATSRRLAARSGVSAVAAISVARSAYRRMKSIDASRTMSTES